MIVEFIVPAGREHYGPRTTEAHWKEYAEHDMLQHLKDAEEVPSVYRDIVGGCSGHSPEVSFEWLEESEEEEGGLR